MKNTLKRGFTLVELLVVVLIIGILSSVALPQYTKAVKKARGVQVLTSASALVKAMNMAYLEDGSYRRYYYDYAGSIGDGNSDFDIEIAPLTNTGSETWQLETNGSGRNCQVIATLYTGNTANPRLVYHLSEGKISSITCSGNLCSTYFPGSMLSSN